MVQYSVSARARARHRSARRRAALPARGVARGRARHGRRLTGDGKGEEAVPREREQAAAEQRKDERLGHAEPEAEHVVPDKGLPPAVRRPLQLDGVEHLGLGLVKEEGALGLGARRVCKLGVRIEHLLRHEQLSGIHGKV